MRVTTRSKADAERVSKGELLRSASYDAIIREAVERPSKTGRDMLELLVVVRDDQGNEREIRDFLTDAPLAAARLRSLCVAVNCLAQYDAGEITADLFPGQVVRVRIEVEKRRGWPDRNVVASYAAATASGVVTLRSAG